MQRGGGQRRGSAAAARRALGCGSGCSAARSVCCGWAGVGRKGCASPPGSPEGPRLVLRGSNTGTAPRYREEVPAQTEQRPRGLPEGCGTLGEPPAPSLAVLGHRQLLSWRSCSYLAGRAGLRRDIPELVCSLHPKRGGPWGGPFLSPRVAALLCRAAAHSERRWLRGAAPTAGVGVTRDYRCGSASLGGSAGGCLCSAPLEDNRVTGVGACRWLPAPEPQRVAGPVRQSRCFLGRAGPRAASLSRRSPGGWARRGRGTRRPPRFPGCGMRCCGRGGMVRERVTLPMKRS